MKHSKLILPLSIVIASIILGGFFYAIQVNKQRSIEYQQEIKLAGEQKIQETKLKETREIQEAKLEQEQKEYIAKRKNDCYSLYEKERDKWGNVKGNEYNEEKDICIIRYKADKEWEGKNCDDYIPGDDLSDLLRDFSWKRYFNCEDNSFTNEF